VDVLGENLFWWFGVVEDRNDPLQLGRVRVRIAGLHSPLKQPDPTTGQGIETNALMWAHPLLPVTEASVSGVGQAPVGLVQGSWVFGFARDGKTCQDLVVVGTFGGIPTEKANPNAGFNDPEGKWPKEEYIGEPDTNRLARNDSQKQHPVLDAKEKARKKGVKTADGQTWDEPASPYNAEYPLNKVKETEGGHIVEFDDTPQHERIHVYHKAGTFQEIHPDGTSVVRIVGKNYTIVASDNNIAIDGKCNITVNSDCSLQVNGNATIDVQKDVTQTVHGNVKQHVSGNVNETVDSNKNTTVQGNYDVSVSGNFKVTAKRIDLN